MAPLYYAIYCRGHIVQCKDRKGRKMPLVFLSQRQAEEEAERRTLKLKKNNTVSTITTVI